MGGKNETLGLPVFDFTTEKLMLPFLVGFTCLITVVLQLATEWQIQLIL